MSQLALRYEIKSKYHRSVLHLSCIIKTQARLSMQCHLPSMYYTPWYCRKRVYRKNTRIRIRSSYPSGSANLLYKEYAIYGEHVVLSRLSLGYSTIYSPVHIYLSISIYYIDLSKYIQSGLRLSFVNKSVPSALHVLYSLVLKEAGVPENARIRIHYSYPSGSKSLLYKEYDTYGYITGDNVTARLAAHIMIASSFIMFIFKISAICAASFLWYQDTG